MIAAEGGVGFFGIILGGVVALGICDPSEGARCVDGRAVLCKSPSPVLTEEGVVDSIEGAGFGTSFSE